MVHQVNPNLTNGLSESQAAIILKQEGYNELPSSKQQSFLIIAWEIIKDPIFLLLVACGIIYFTLGDIEEALILLGFVFFIMGISLYQETKTERALEALQDLSSPRALVIRDGQYVPFLRHLFRFSYLHPIDLAICLAAGIICFFWFELLKIRSK